MCEGKPLANDKDDTSERAVQIIPKMKESCLFLQGPPGTGKTYTGSKSIVALIKQGMRVAVSANSHKAVTCGNRGGDGRSFSRLRGGGGHCVDDNIEW